MGQQTNFAVVLKSGGDFKIRHVWRLYEQICFAYRKPFEFFVLTDLPDTMNIPGNYIKLQQDLPGWFSKIELFSFDMGRVCFNDLDVTINKPLDWVDQHSTDGGLIWTMECEHGGKPCGNLNSSTMIWHGPRPEIATAFNKDIHIEMYSKPEPPYYGDQNFIQHHINPEQWRLLPRHYFAAYPWDIGKRWDNCKIRMYVRQQRPWTIDGHEEPSWQFSKPNTGV